MSRSRNRSAQERASPALDQRTNKCFSSRRCAVNFSHGKDRIPPMPGSRWIRLIRQGGQPMRRIVLAQIVLLALLLWGISPDVAGAEEPGHGRYTTTAGVLLSPGR